MRGRIIQFTIIVAAMLVMGAVPEETAGVGLKIQLVLFAISVGVALVGIHLGLDARRVFIERREVIARHERPHVVETLEVLFVDMAQTTAIAKNIDYGDVGVVNARSVTYARIDRHIDLERQIASRFLEVGLSKLHVYLDSPFRALGEIRALEFMPNNSVDDRKAVDENMIGRLDDAMSAVVQVINSIKSEPSP